VPGSSVSDNQSGWAIVMTADGPALGAAAVYGTTVVRGAGAWKFRKVMLGMDGYAGGAPTR
jgi:hypothetical protein